MATSAKSDPNPDPSAQQIGLWKKQRTMTKINADREAKKASEIMTEFDSSQHDELLIAKGKLTTYLQKLQEFEGKILPLSEEEEVESELAESNQREQPITDLMLRAEIYLKKSELPGPSPSSPISPHNANPRPDSTITAKLPKLLIHPFSGDCLKWREFWDAFNVSVHRKDNLSPVEKFQYLKSFLRGEAYRLIEGYTLSSGTYDTAVAALEERYDHPEWCINIHLDTMIYMKECENTVEDIQKTLDSCEAHIRGLVSLGMEEDTFESVFAPLVLSKFPRAMRIELNRKNGAAAWSLCNLRKYLKEEILARQLGLQTVGGQQDKSSNKEKSQAIRNQRESGGTASSLLSSANRNDPSKQPRYPCAFCKGQGHFPQDGKRVSNSSDRYKALGSGQCLLCLSPHHRKSECKSDRPCRNCGVKRSHHHSLCHKKYGVKKQNQPAQVFNAKAESFVPAGSLMSESVSKTDQETLTRGISILGIACATIAGPHGTAKVHVALDNCSTRSFARLEALKRIGARLVSEEHLGLAGLDSSARRYDKFGRYEVTINCLGGETCTIVVNGLQTITCPIENHQLSDEQYPLLRQFGLGANIEVSNQPIKLDILIGLDQYYRIVTNIAVRLSDTLVVLETKLGYIINGSSQILDPNHAQDATVMLAIDKGTPDEELGKRLQTLWELEDVGVKVSSDKEEDLIAEKKFLDEISYDSTSSRYAVRWPWKEMRQTLPINYGLALGRLKGLLRSLDQSTLAVYDQTIQDQLKIGMIEVAPGVPSGDQVHYIPHHCVVKPDHSTTKLRIVYDASAKPCKADQSLNESMYSGPTQLNDLCGLLIRFRQHRVGIASDIEKAFLQISIKPQDRDVTRFLWVKDIELPAFQYNLITYRFARVLFGVTASPFMLSGTIKYHLQQQNSAVAEKILKNCYVDNVITGTDNPQEALEFYHQAKTMFTSASMNLRQWISNDSDFMNSIDADDICSEAATSILGLQWDMSADTIKCKSKVAVDTSCRTKRQLLHVIAQLFDPLGFFHPVSVVGKLLLQELWKQKLDWDDCVSEDLQHRFERFLKNLTDLPLVAIPRYIGGSSDATIQLHCFVDASMQAYSAVVYQRNQWDSNIESHLIFSKVKVSPLKQKLTIPKLELTALALGSKILSFVKTELQRLVSHAFLWTDSQCAFHWVIRDAKLPVFIKNRVKEIKKVSNVTLRFVPTDQNPGDLPTKEISSAKIKTSSLWWSGPGFLRQNPTQWPTMPAELTACGETHCCAEPPNATIVCLSESEAVVCPIDLDRISTLHRAIAVVAWIYRFFNKSLKRIESTSQYLTAAERRSSFNTLIRLTQSKFAATNPQELRRLSGGLKLFVDPSGLQRCGGYLDRGDTPYETCYPIFIPRSSDLCRLIIRDAHEKHGHAGMQHVLSLLRQGFWIPRARFAIKMVLHACPVCRQWKGGAFRTPNAP